jgi:hypothetical protein
MRTLRQSPVALIALIVALGGTAWAAARAGSGDIAKNAIRSKHIAAKQVKRPDVNANSLGGAFGAGVLGGMITEFNVEEGLSSATDAIAPIGEGIQPDGHLYVAMPRRTTFRDLHFRLTGGDTVPAGRTVRLDLIRTGGPGALSCTIPSGGTRCSSAAGDRLTLRRNQLLGAQIEGVGDGDVELPAMTYLFGYREAP